MRELSAQFISVAIAINDLIATLEVINADSSFRAQELESTVKMVGMSGRRGSVSLTNTNKPFNSERTPLEPLSLDSSAVKRLD